MPRGSALGIVLREHDGVLVEFIDAVRGIRSIHWQQPMGPGRWSPAALTLHVIRAYEFGITSARGSKGMALRVPPVAAWVSGRFMLPVLLAFKRFPQGADAPPEVLPDLTEAELLSPEGAIARLEDTARRAAEALCQPSASAVVHAYFGSLPARQALRLLSAHTRHHARGLRPHLSATVA
jgi:hypothetical protein